ncbi:hypothetical protein GCM10028794_00110 [Silanimonas algicola]
MSRPGTPDDLLHAALAGLLPDDRPAPDVAGRLRATLMARLPRAPLAATRAHEGTWRPLLPGVRLKTLREDGIEAGTQTALWRLDAGAVIPGHRHATEEECLVLEGSVVYDDVEYHAGDFLLARRGEAHGPFHSPRGALLLIRGERLPSSPRAHE